MRHISCGFSVKHQITQVTQPHYSPDLAPCNSWLFPKLKSLLKGKKFQTIMRFRKRGWGGWWWLGELCKVPSCLLRSVIILCTMFLISSSINVCCSCCMAGYLLDRPTTLAEYSLSSFRLSYTNAQSPAPCKCNGLLKYIISKAILYLDIHSNFFPSLCSSF